MDFREATDRLAIPLETVVEAVGKGYATVPACRPEQKESPPEVMAGVGKLMRQHGGELQQLAEELERARGERKGVHE